MIESRAFAASWALLGLFQSGPWQQLADPAQAGWSIEKLEAARQLAERAGSAAVLAIDHGHVAIAWGSVEVPLECHSVRKSLVSLLFGPHVESGAIDLDATLEQLGLDDEPPLTEDEKRARVRDLLAGRSGVYHAAAKEPLDMKKERPQRGSAVPGERFFYNNWDFNGAGVVLARATGHAVGDEFEERFAVPLGFEDFEREHDAFDQLEPCSSIHPAYAFRLSARDLARIGQLVVQRGRWNDEVLLPASWIEASTRATTTFDGGRGYGFMWWTYAKSSLEKSGGHPALDRFDKFAAIGTGGQLLLIVPEADFVFVHRGDTDHDRHVGGGQVWKIAEAVFAARGTPSKAEPDLIPLTPTPFAKSLEPLPHREAAPLDAARIEELVGTYKGAGFSVDLHRHGDRLFARTADGEETELLAEAGEKDRFFAKGTNLTVDLERDDAGRVVGTKVSLFGKELRALRIDR